MTDAPYFIVMGEEPRRFAISHYKLISGEGLSGRRQILLGQLAARNFKKDVGDLFGLNEVSYRVIGIYETGVSLEDGGGVISLADAQARIRQIVSQVSYFSVKVKDPRASTKCVKKLKNAGKI